MIKYILILFSLILISCNSNTPSSEYYNNKQNPNISSEIQPDVKEVGSGVVDIEDDTEEDIKEDDEEPYVVDPQLEQTAVERMNELIMMPKYVRNNRRLKRNKIAKQLNREHFRKPDGEKFRRRDIPKYK